MNTIPNRNNLPFQSRFEFINFKRFYELTYMKGSKDIAVEVNNLGADFKEIAGGGRLFTMGLGSCTAYGLTAKELKKAILGHYQYSAHEVIEAIKKAAKGIRGKPRAFVIGGDSDALSEFAQEGIKGFRASRIPTTILWGQNYKQHYNWTNLCLDLNEDTCYIFTNAGDSLCDSVAANSIEEVKSSFQFIRIAQGDELYIDGKYVPPKLLNQGDIKALINRPSIRYF